MNEPIPDDTFAYHEFEIRRLEKELKAAREVVIYATNVLRFTPHAVAACYSTKCECFHAPLAESIARYDEARQK